MKQLNDRMNYVWMKKLCFLNITELINITEIKKIRAECKRTKHTIKIHSIDAQPDRSPHLFMTPSIIHLCTHVSSVSPPGAPSIVQHYGTRQTSKLRSVAAIGKFIPHHAMKRIGTTLRENGFRIREWKQKVYTSVFCEWVNMISGIQNALKNAIDVVSGYLVGFTTTSTARTTRRLLSRNYIRPCVSR